MGEGRFYDENTFLRLSNKGNVFAVLRIQHRVPRIWRANDGWLRRRQKRSETTGLSCYLKRNPSLVNFHPAIFCLNTFPKFIHKLCRRTRKNVMYSHLRTSLRGNSGIRGRQNLPCFLHRWREVFASGENQRRRATSQSENRQTVFSF